MSKPFGRRELDDELNKRAGRDTLPRFALRPAALDDAHYARFAKFLSHHGKIKSAGAVSDYTTELLPFE
jgi:putative hydroxymethylpyrimidine transport system substrate-binding protein